jgi:hypothetical protein
VLRPTRRLGDSAGSLRPARARTLQRRRVHPCGRSERDRGPVERAEDHLDQGRLARALRLRHMDARALDHDLSPPSRTAITPTLADSVDLRACFLTFRSAFFAADTRARSSMVVTTSGRVLPKRFTYRSSMNSGRGSFQGSCRWLSLPRASPGSSRAREPSVRARARDDVACARLPTPEASGRAWSSSPSVHVTPQHFLYFLPDPHEHGSLRPTFAVRRWSPPRGAPTIRPASPCMKVARRANRSR